MYLAASKRPLVLSDCLSCLCGTKVKVDLLLCWWWWCWLVGFGCLSRGRQSSPQCKNVVGNSCRVIEPEGKEEEGKGRWLSSPKTQTVSSQLTPPLPNFKEGFRGLNAFFSCYWVCCCKEVRLNKQCKYREKM